MPDGPTLDPAELAFATCFVQLAQKGARRGSQRDSGNVRKELRGQNSSGFRNSRAAKCKGRHEDKCGASDGRIRRGIARPHRAIILSRDAHRGAIAFVPLEIARLTMVHRAIGRVATSGQSGGGKSFREGGNTRQKQCQKSRYGSDFACDVPQF